ncbi:hypothetical protein CHS0354_026872 [Potamilus streckersoni]|uniref:Uncharacterized protein n=1 Tax=Potamilus streckersoni TaxID=2493646 RepID=A0AAE0SP91_9BIVA|nr:hypothetical protein CHS0354_026872 [Potamilus streckersoni]
MIFHARGFGNKRPAAPGATAPSVPPPPLPPVFPALIIQLFEGVLVLTNEINALGGVLKRHKRCVNPANRALTKVYPAGRKLDLTSRQ